MSSYRLLVMVTLSILLAFTVPACKGLGASGQSGTPDGGTSGVVESLLSRMTLEEKIGQLLICRVPRDINAYVNDYHIGGFILFAGDITSAGQVQSLTARMRNAAADTPNRIPLFIAIDEEGGTVSRIGKLYGNDIPPMLEIGQTGDTRKAYDAALTMGKRLTSLGVTMNFAPIADVWSNKQNTVIGKRAFSTDAETAAVMVASAVRGFRDAGILSVVKHFPGHGDTVQDSHRELAVYPYGRERFDRTESLPFVSGIAAGTDGVMIGHIATPRLGNDAVPLSWMEPWRKSGRLPATFSTYWIQDVLRDAMNYDGLVITDGLEMGALTRNFSARQITLGAFMAGVDILLIPPDIPAAIDALTQAYHDGTITGERLDESVKRILAVKLRLEG